jgi:L-lactate dehydrogenase (cytochrome)
MKWKFDTNYPSVDDLRAKAKRRVPRFAFEYLEGGCNEDINLSRNVNDISEIQLMPRYLRKFGSPDLSAELFGHVYDAPFGISPIGLQGLIWPNAAEILARAAYNHNIPFILSTVSTSSIERIAELTDGKAWFQLYHPAKDELRDDLLRRVATARFPVLVVLVDVPSFGFRPRDIRNGLAMPPKMNMRNFVQMMGKPIWGIRTLQAGIPHFATLKNYIPSGYDMARLGQFMNETFAGRIDSEKIKPIREMWKGKLVLKGIVNEADIEQAIALGVDGIIVSNHGGRQIDAGESSVKSLERLRTQHRGRLKIMVDSGLRSGPDVARCVASGADFTFMGRTFMYGAAALGSRGGEHTISILKTQLWQVMEQLGCARVDQLPEHLIKSRRMDD